MFGAFGRKRDPHFEQEVETELRYLRNAFPDDPLGAAREKLKRRSAEDPEHRVIQAAIDALKATGPRRSR
jgi:hypothetical protein